MCIRDRLERVEPLAKSGIIGVSWSSIGGEAAGLLNENHLAADGIENVIKVLEELEDEKLQELDFIELNACAGGCVGGIFAAENGYVARARIQRLRKYLPVSCNRLQDAESGRELDVYKRQVYNTARRNGPLRPLPRLLP